MKNKKYLLITGAAGFYGQNFINFYIKEKNFKILAVDRKKLRYTGAKTIFKKINLNESNDLKNLVTFIKKKKISIEAIIHLAGAVSKESLKENLEGNFYTTKNIINFSNHIRCSKFVYMSAIAANYKLKTNYAISKIKSEKLVRKLKNNWIVLRPSITFGKNGEEFELIINFLKKFKTFIITDRNVSKQPIHVEDVIKITNKIILSKNKKIWKRIVNIAGDKTYTLESFIRNIAKQLNINLRIIKIPYSLLKLATLIFQVIFPSLISRDKLYGLAQGPVINNKFTKNFLKYKIINTEKKLNKIINFYKNL